MEHHSGHAQEQNNAGQDTAVLALRGVLLVLSWLLWTLFLFVPTATGLHGTAFLDLSNSIVFTLIGFSLCTAQNTAAQSGHYIKMIVFAFGITLLSVWF